jgi:hypothetical protein
MAIQAVAQAQCTSFRLNFVHNRLTSMSYWNSHGVNNMGATVYGRLPGVLRPALRFGNAAALAPLTLPMLPAIPTLVPAARIATKSPPTSAAAPLAADTGPVVSANSPIVGKPVQTANLITPTAIDKPKTLTAEQFQERMVAVRQHGQVIQRTFRSVFNTPTILERFQQKMGRLAPPVAPDAVLPEFMTATQALVKDLSVSEDGQTLQFQKTPLTSVQANSLLDTVINHLNKALLVSMFGTLETIPKSTELKGNFAEATEAMLSFLEKLKPLRGGMSLRQSMVHPKSLVPETLTSYMTYLMVTKENLGPDADAKLNAWNDRVIALGASTRSVDVHTTTIKETWQKLTRWLGRVTN